MNKVEKGHTFKVDPKKKPAHIDVTDNNGKTVQGIYKLEKDELFICIGERSGKRPTDFAGKDVRGKPVFTFNMLGLKPEGSLK